MRGKITCHKRRPKLSCKAFEASLAQLVEQRFRKAWVAGSNPATGSIPESLHNNVLAVIFRTFSVVLSPSSFAKFELDTVLDTRLVPNRMPLRCLTLIFKIGRK